MLRDMEKIVEDETALYSCDKPDINPSLTREAAKAWFIANEAIIRRDVKDIITGGVTQTEQIRWPTDHGFTGEILDNFKMIVTFVVQVYFPIFFDIKVKHSIVNGPYHIIKQLIQRPSFLLC